MQCIAAGEPAFVTVQIPFPHNVTINLPMIAGPRGFPGSKGMKGDMGVAGPKGNAGSKGLTGAHLIFKFYKFLYIIYNAMYNSLRTSFRYSSNNVATQCDY